MTCVAGHQPNLYPYGGFFAKAASVDIFVIVDSTQYVKKEYHNRNRIKLLDGNVHWLTIPVKNSGRYAQMINEVEIDNSRDWRKVHLRTLLLNYKRAPHFARYFPAVEELLSRQWTMLAEFNIAFILRAMELLGIEVPVRRTSAEGMEGKASELIVDICRKTGADCYLHGRHSRDYVDFGMLEKAGIGSRIQDFACPAYAQTTEPFTPNLSIIDILFNCGEDSRSLLEQGNRIISA